VTVKTKEKGIKIYADARRHAVESDIKISNQVLLKQDRKDKLTPNLYEEPYDVIERSGNAVTITDGNHVKYKRNITHVKQYNNTNAELKEDSTSVIPEDATQTQSDESGGKDATETPIFSPGRPKRETKLPPS
jgi:hypothetical protein